jgi:biopolymer transport protein ExbD
MGIELFCVLNVLALAYAFFLLNSRFLLSPGIAISLPGTADVECRKTVGTVSVQSEKLVVFNGNIFSLDTIGTGMRKFLRANHLENTAEPAILIRPDEALPVSVLIKICEIAKKSGFSTAQIATLSSRVPAGTD